jgi:hypothetical protein
MDMIKSNDSKVSEKIQQNRELYFYDCKRFYYSLNIEYLMDHIIKTIRFLYSLQGLKNYFSYSRKKTEVISKDTKLKLECIFIVAAIVEKNLTASEKRLYDFGEMLEQLFMDEALAQNMTTFHIRIAIKMFLNRFKAKDFETNHVYDLLNEFFENVELVSLKNKWNSKIDKLSKHYLTNFDMFLVKYSDRIEETDFNLNLPNVYFVEENFNYSENSINKDEREGLEYQPELFTYGIAKDFTDKIDNYLLNVLNVALKDFDLNYYKDKFFLFESKTYKARYAFQQSIVDVINGTTEKAILKLQNKRIEIKKDEVCDIIGGLLKKDELIYSS